MDTYPEYNDDGSQELSFKNLWMDGQPQSITGADCFVPSVNVNPDENLLELKLSGLEFRKMLSALYTGAVISYPSEYLQIIVNFLAGLHCPPEFVDEMCQPFPSYAPFVGYPLQNPYSQPELIPDGYLIPPFIAVTPENEEEYPDNELFDIIVPFGAVSLDADWFEELDGQLPTITIRANGAGKVEIKLLTALQGGVAIITVDNPPNLVEILAGVITGADNIVDVQKDVVSLPPETADEIIYEVELVGNTEHIVYIVFFPIIDDSLIPLRFGGGFRGVNLCGFTEGVDMGVTDVRWNDDNFMLEQQKMGIYEPVTDFQLFLDYLDELEAALQENISSRAYAADLEALNGDFSTLNSFVMSDLEPRVASLELQVGDHAVRLDDIDASIADHETRLDAAEANIAAHDATLTDHEGRLIALESADSPATALQVWYEVFDTQNEDVWNGGDSWVDGEGILITEAYPDINHPSLSMFDHRVTYIEITVKRATGTGSQSSGTVEYPDNENAQYFRFPASNGAVVTNWLQINDVPPASPVQLSFTLPTPYPTDKTYYIQRIVVWGKGENPF